MLHCNSKEADEVERSPFSGGFLTLRNGTAGAWLLSERFSFCHLRSAYIISLFVHVHACLGFGIIWRCIACCHVCSAIGVSDEYISVSCRICPGLNGNGTIMGWLSPRS